MAVKLMALTTVAVVLAAVAAISLWRVDHVSDEWFVSYERSGGYAGVSDHLIVYGDGRAVLSTGRGPGYERLHIRIPQSQMERLRALFDDAPSPEDEQVSFGPPPATTVLDAYEFRLLHSGGSVKAIDGYEPPWLDEILTELGEIVDSHSSVSSV